MRGLREGLALVSSGAVSHEPRDVFQVSGHRTAEARSGQEEVVTVGTVLRGLQQKNKKKRTKTKKLSDLMQK